LHNVWVKAHELVMAERERVFRHMRFGLVAGTPFSRVTKDQEEFE
jgi:hypothetical protein